MGMRELLHVEDEDAMAFVFRAAVEEANIQMTVYRVSNGQQALAYLRRVEPYTAVMRPALVFLDLNLPRLDGWQVLLEMRDEESLASIPVVILSTLCRQADKDRIYALGAKRCITKPTIFSLLVFEIKSACQEFAA